jgi:hypothetical protein
MKNFDLFEDFKAVLDEEETDLTQKLLKENGEEKYFGELSEDIKERIEEREKFLAESMARAHEIWLR